VCQELVKGSCRRTRFLKGFFFTTKDTKNTKSTKKRGEEEA